MSDAQNPPAPLAERTDPHPWEAYDEWGYHEPVLCWTEAGAIATASRLSNSINRWRHRARF